MKSLALGVALMGVAGYVVWKNVTQLTTGLLVFAAALLVLGGLLVNAEPMKAALAELVTFGKGAKDAVKE